MRAFCVPNSVYIRPSTDSSNYVANTVSREKTLFSCKSPTTVAQFLHPICLNKSETLKELPDLNFMALKKAY